MAEASDDLLDLGWTKLRWALCAALVTSLFASVIFVAIRQPPTTWPAPAPTESAVMVNLEPAATTPSAAPSQEAASAPPAEPSQPASEPPLTQAKPEPPEAAPAAPPPDTTQVPQQPSEQPAVPPTEPSQATSEPPPTPALAKPEPPEAAPAVPAPDVAVPMPPPAPPRSPAEQREQTAARRPPPRHPHPDRTPAAHATSTAPHAEAPPERTTARLPPAPYADRTPIGPATSTAPHAAVSQTPAPTMAPADPYAISGWRNELLQRLLRAKRYPEEARDRDQQGVVQLRISMDRQGKLLSATVVKSSGYAVLDEEAVATMHRAEPFPEPPSQMPGNPIELTVPVHFSLQ